MKYLVVALFLFVSFFSGAQYVRPGDQNSPAQISNNQTPGFWNNVSIGGTFQLQFGDYTDLGLEPLLNYHFGNNFIVGVGPIYQYLNVSEQVYGVPYTSSIYGARISGMYFLPDPVSRLFIMGEFDVINLPEDGYNFSGNWTEGRGNLEIPLFGLGYKEPVSNKMFFTIYIEWNFNNSPYNPYTNPLINFGFDVGL